MIASPFSHDHLVRLSLGLLGAFHFLLLLVFIVTLFFAMNRSHAYASMNTGLPRTSGTVVALIG